MPPEAVKITTEDATFQQLEVLRRNRNKRHKSRTFLVEGVRLINHLVTTDWHIEALLFSREAGLSDWAETVIIKSRTPIHYELPLSLLRQLSGKNNASELICVVAFKEQSFSRINIAAPPFIVLVDRPSNPGNLGTIIRSCDAFRADGLILTGHAVDLYDPGTLAATAGSFFAVPALQFASHKDVLPFFEEIEKKHGTLQIIGSSAKAQTSLYEVDYTRPTVLLVGNEEKGLSHFYQELANLTVSIPIAGKAATSLNVAAATAIFLAEAHRQRGWAK